MRKLAKAAALTFLRSTGFFALASQSAGRRTSLLILCYHGISLRDEHQWMGSLYIPASLFRQRLEALRDFRAEVLPLGEALELLRAGHLPPRSVCITFDDGFFDFERHAVPLLREFSFPATLYLTTHYCRNPFPVFNLIVNYVLWKSGRDVFAWPELGIESTSIRAEQERWMVVRSLLAKAEKEQMDTFGKNELARRLASLVGVDYDDLARERMFRILTPEQASRLACVGIDLQLHTHRHRTPRDRELFIREIEDNRCQLREITGREAVHFCYPSGDHHPEFLPWLRDLGLASATTCEAGLAHRDSEVLLLPRILDGSQVSPLEFEACLSGVTL